MSYEFFCMLNSWVNIEKRSVVEVSWTELIEEMSSLLQKIFFFKIETYLFNINRNNIDNW
jgi:hypothetical protein